ncbi:MAG TPA: CBS domain-containing protein [candidate division Zixibacteria bacterium]|nr:CBS domain-containing protein [candidate division Zixibacteria bacterium]
MDRSLEAITQSTPIREVDQVLTGADTVIAHADDSLHRLAELALEHPSCRVISVVDDDQRLVGLIPVRILVNDIFLKIVPEEFLGEITDVDAVMKYADHVRARTARDIMLEPVSVHYGETVRDAFHKMHEHRLNGLPIVNEEGRVVSYLDQLELLLAWVRASGRGALLEPRDRG